MGRITGIFKAALLGAPLLLAAPAFSGELELKSIMGELGAGMEEITGAILVGDYARVESKARDVADHRRPSIEERKEILKFLGSEGGEFKAADEAVHSSAGELAEAARRKDSRGVIEGYSKVLAGCASCHERFRTRIIGHFYRGE